MLSVQGGAIVFPPTDGRGSAPTICRGLAPAPHVPFPYFLPLLPDLLPRRSRNTMAHDHAFIGVKQMSRQSYFMVVEVGKV